MKKTTAVISMLVCIVIMAPQGMSREQSAANTLSAAEKAAGWVLLFDGKSLSNWKKFRRPNPPGPCWVIEEGALKRENGHGTGECGDIDTRAEFSNFEFSFEWRISVNGNSGVKYFVVEDRPTSWEKISLEMEIENLKEEKPPDRRIIANLTVQDFMYWPIGFEFQLIDDEKNEDAQAGPNHKTGALYDMLAPASNPVRPVGEWNQGRIIVQGKHFEHWVNGVKILESTLDSEHLKTAIAKSKFRRYEGFGTMNRGRIDLQDHGSEVWFRNLKIRNLSLK